MFAICVVALAQKLSWWHLQIDFYEEVDVIYFPEKILKRFRAWVILSWVMVRQCLNEYELASMMKTVGVKLVSVLQGRMWHKKDYSILW